MLAHQFKNTGPLLDSLDAMRNWRGMLLLLITFVITALIFTVGGLMAQLSNMLFLPFALLAWAVMFYGANAVGLMMMDEAQGHACRSVKDALLASLVTSHRLIAVFILILAVYLLGALAVALAVLLCRLPGLGQLLYAAVFPLGVAFAGLALFALPTLVFPLAAPAVWSGASTLGALGQVTAIARQRFLMVLMLMIAVSLMAVVVALVVGTVLTAGTSFVTLLSTAILSGVTIGPWVGFGFGLNALDRDALTVIDGHAAAALWGGGLLYLAALTLPAMVYLRGAGTVYLRAIAGLDLQAEEHAFGQRVAEARDRARTVQAQARATAQRYAQRAPVPAPHDGQDAAVAATAAADGGAANQSPPVAAGVLPRDCGSLSAFEQTTANDEMNASAQTPRPASPGLSSAVDQACPVCSNPVASDDDYCSNCGHRLSA